jgi:hypothetical protein
MKVKSNFKIVSLIHGILLISFILIIILFKELDGALIIPTAFGLLASYIGWTQYTLQQDNFFKELFKDFTKRYDEDYSAFFNIIDPNVPEYDITDNDRVLVIKYLSFCAEEFLWYKKGRIDKETWINWKAGILVNLKHPLILEIYLAEKQECQSSYYGLFAELKINNKPE